MRIEKDNKDWELFEKLILGDKTLRNTGFYRQEGDTIIREDGNNIRISEFRFWDDERKKEIFDKIKEFNKNSKELLMMSRSFNDGEKEDDRIVNAQYSFVFRKKI
jgi:hypothetical protein